MGKNRPASGGFLPVSLRPWLASRVFLGRTDCDLVASLSGRGAALGLRISEGNDAWRFSFPGASASGGTSLSLLSRRRADRPPHKRAIQEQDPHDVANLATAPALVTTIFGLTYLMLAIGRVPGLKTDRAGVALIGASAMLACGAIDMDEAARAVDFNTIVLLLGMMVVVGVLKLAGFFTLANEQLAARFSGPRTLLAVIIALSGVLSAFLVNDVVCLAMTPLTLALCQRLKRPPIPYLVGLATAANIGSVATITGNPQNMIIGSLSHLSYLRFSARLAPIALVGLVLNYAIVAIVYRKMLGETTPDRRWLGQAPQPRIHAALLVKSLTVTLIMVGLFFAGQPIALVALAAAAFLMLDRLRPEKIYQAIDWPLLVMFAGLFVVVRAFEMHVVHAWRLDQWHALRDSPVVLISALSVGLSNLVSNVPAVLLFKPLIEAIPQQEQAWLALSMSSTLAGNLTLLGSVANLIVVESARRAGTELSFLEYLKVGAPLTVLTTLTGAAWLALTTY